ncbi:septum formation family protein [Arthrobacter roseus]|uniref:septum formation family protein n=1 Tax=Arthrobacter roseus TaxID=136274 RepID=UPI001963CBC1|nr:septum formation family protein [Arthrobacter roseus]MBM7849680.1 type II secretory pathway pseudopilin PulG [Arthrobacter roseus]
MNSKKSKGDDAQPTTASGVDPAVGEEGLPNLAASSDAPEWLQVGADAKRWGIIFSNETKAGDVPVDVEPELGVTPEDVELQEPSLAAVEISDDTAEAAELQAVAEEARRVAKEAEEAGRLAGGVPLVGSPGTKTKNSPDNDPDADTPPHDDVDKVNEGSTPSEGADTPEETMNPQQSPPRSKPAAHMGAGGSASGWTPSSDSPAQDSPGQSSPGQDSPKRRPRGNHSAPVKTNYLPLILVGLAILAALALIIFIVVNLFSGRLGGSAEGEAEGVIAQDVSPLDLQEGQCLQGFEDINSEVTVVTCDTPHNAELVATFTYPDETQYPGKESLRTKAAETCEGATLNADAIRKFDELRQTEASPGEKTWSNGDRRVDCYVFTDEAGTLVESLLIS